MKNFVTIQVNEKLILLFSAIPYSIFAAVTNLKFNYMGTKKVTKSTTSRAKPLTSKAGVTKNGKRRYGCGGKLK